METTNQILNLFVPEWQGYAVDDSPQGGAKCLRDWIFSDYEFAEIEIDKPPLPDTQNGIMGYRSVTRTLQAMKAAIESADPSHCFTLGGT